MSYRVLKSKRSHKSRGHNSSVIVETKSKIRTSANDSRMTREVMKGNFAVTKQQYKDLIIVKENVTPTATYKVSKLRTSVNRDFFHGSS